MKLDRYFAVGASSALFAALCVAAPASAQEGREGEDDLEETPHVSVRSGDARASLDASEPLDDMEVDGVADEPEWRGARVFTGFTQQEPVEGAPVEHDTEVRVLFGGDAIWIAARMWDTEPERIVRRLTRRDSHGEFDQFSVHLDPNLDGLTGYRFALSAAGVQTDAYMYNDDQMDGAWDAVWSSAVRVDEHGWTAEMRIPLSQIRYESSDELQTWGINFFRGRTASNERSYYSLVSRLRSGRVSQMARIEGVRVPRPSRRFELLPYAVSSVHRGPAEEGDPFFDGTAANGRVGMDLSYGLGGAFTLDATINPDFGQVEADPAVINLSAFETFFREQRPFFVEDARVFDFDLSGGQNQLFYSRRVGRSPQGDAPDDAVYADVPSNATILGAAKLAGRTSSGFSLGALAAVTGGEHGRALYDDGTRGEFLVEPRSEFGVLSVAKDFNGGASQVRGIGTAMRRALPESGSFDWLPSSAFNAGLRFEHQWSDREWALWGFFAGSHVRGTEEAITRIQTASNHYFQRPDATRLEVDPARRSISGLDWRLQFERRSGEHWTGSVWAGETTSGFEINDVGFSTTAERLDGGMRVGYREIVPGDVFRSYNVNFSTYHNWSHEALDDTWSLGSWQHAKLRGNYSLNFNGDLLNYWGFRVNANYSPRAMSRSATRGGPMMVSPASTRFSVNVDSDRRRRVSVGGNVEVSDDLDGEGGGWQVRTDVRLQASDNVSVSVNPRYEVQRSGDQYVTAADVLPYGPTYGTRYLFAELDRRTFSMETRLDWTFSPALSLQLFAQPLLSSGDYVRYRQLAAAETYDFVDLEPGEASNEPGGVTCSAAICETDGTQHVDFDGDGVSDYSFGDRDFNVRSLIGNAVLRWEYRPGSTLYVVWQRAQSQRALTGDFDFGRDAGALFRAPADDRFIVKLSYWLGI